MGRRLSYRIRVSDRNCDGDVTRRMIALLLREIAIELNLRHERMFKYGGEVRRGYWRGNMEESVRSEDVEVDVRIGSECILNKEDGRALNGLIWLTTWAFGGLLLAR
jgi:hypothetical protein